MIYMTLYMYIIIKKSVCYVQKKNLYALRRVCKSLMKWLWLYLIIVSAPFAPYTRWPGWVGQ